MRTTQLQIILVVFLFLFSYSQAANKCYWRREWRKLSLSEQNKFVQAIHNLNVKVSGLASIWDQYARWHFQYRTQIHGGSVFFPVHRAMLARVEELIDMAIPYWDEGLDSQNPSASPVWSTFGGNGAPPGSCVPNGRFNGTSFKINITGSLQCLTHNFGFSSFNSKEIMDWQITNKNTYSSFRSSMEAIHGQAHVQIGGQMGAMYSPCNPLFYLHHAYFDYQWWKWQKRGDSFLTAYDGTNSGGVPASANDNLPPVPYLTTTKVKDVFLTHNMTQRFCYHYNTRLILFPLNFTLPVLKLPKGFKRSELAEEQVRLETKVQQQEEEYLVEEEENPDIDYTSPRFSEIPQVRRTYVASQLVVPLKVPEPLPREWLIMNGLSVEEAERDYQATVREIGAINTEWRNQRLEFFPATISNLNEETAEVDSSGIWPVWAIVVTVISSVAIVVVIAGIVIMYKLWKGPTSDGTFQQMS